jgi:hypothetical protein
MIGHLLSKIPDVILAITVVAGFAGVLYCIIKYDEEHNKLK